MKNLQLVAIASINGKDYAYIPESACGLDCLDWAFVTDGGQFRRIFHPNDDEILEMFENTERFPFIKMEKDLPTLIK